MTPCTPALGTGPREVFDLARAPWQWHKKAEQLAEFGEAEHEHKTRRARQRKEFTGW